MKSHAVVAMFGLVALLFVPHRAAAQLSQYNLPVESGILESHIDLQFQYSQTTFRTPLGARDVNVALLSVEGQIEVGERWELSLNLPFLVHGWTTTGEDTEFGDLLLGLKVRLLGVGEQFGVSLFANTYLPTHSGAFTRKYFRLQSGAVASAQLMGFHVGGGVQTVWDIIGEGIEDQGLIGFYTYARVPLLGLIALQAAVEYFNSVEPNGDLNAVLITPSVEVGLLGLHAGIGARIAATDDAQVITLGRAALIANAGFRF